MKRLGIVLLIIGLVLTLITGFRFVTKEKVVDLGNLEITKSDPHKVDWSPYLGIGIMVLGGILLFVSPRR
jgi:hypothetical protein